jgi:hypothetical protein
MVRLRPPCRSAGSPAPGGPTRRFGLPALLVACGACILAVGALVVPGIVLGADPPGTFESADTEPAAPAGSLLVTLPWGSGDGQVGLLQPTEGLVQGPEALAIAPDGRVAVLDSANHRLLLLDPAGQIVGTIAVALAQPRFLAVDDNKLYVLDCDADRRLAVFAWDGADLGTLALPPLTDVVTGLFATSAGPCVEVAHESAFLVSQPAQGVAAVGSDTTTVATARRAAASGGHGRPAQASLHELAGRPLDADLERAARVTFRPGQKVRIRSFEIDKASLGAVSSVDLSPAIASGRSVEHLVSVDGDGNGGFIVGARLLEPEMRNGTPASLALTRLPSVPAEASGAAGPDATASPDEVLLLAESLFAYLGQPYVVAPDGRIFQPVGSDAGYSIVVYTFAASDAVTELEEVQP